MTWLRQQIAPAPHLLEPSETVTSAQAYARSWSVRDLTAKIAEHKRAIEHEQAIVMGFERELESRR